MKTLPKILTPSAIFLIAALALLSACGSSSRSQVTGSWQQDAAKLGIPEQELAWIASEAVKRHGGIVFEMNSPGRAKNVVVVLLADKKTSRSGKLATFKKTADGWKEDEAAAGQWTD
jgi:hypothetical protein